MNASSPSSVLSSTLYLIPYLSDSSESCSKTVLKSVVVPEKSKKSWYMSSSSRSSNAITMSTELLLPVLIGKVLFAVAGGHIFPAPLPPL